MTPVTERAALVALLRLGRRPYGEYAELVQTAGSATESLAAELGETARQASLLPGDPAPLIEQARLELDGWSAEGIRVLSVLDPDYPLNLWAVHDRPPVLFLAGELRPGDAHSVAVIGSRRASAAGRGRAGELAGHLAASGYTINSGLAAGIDTAAHAAALAAGGRTIAVIGTGLRHSYPPQNAPLQRRLAEEGAVISPFWPDAPPSRQSFPMRNAVMSGISLATAVVEASHRSGTRVQARLALAHGRPLFLHRGLLDQDWAREMSTRPGTHVFDSPDEIIAAVDRLISLSPLVE